MSGAAPTVVIRCDASAEAGLGHASRCGALAAALATLGYRASFAGSFVDEALALLPETASVTPDPGSATALAELAHDADAAAIVVDGYGFDAAYLDTLAPRQTGTALVVVDDFATTPLPTGAIVINFTLGAERLPYPNDALAVLRGPEFLLLGSSFAEARRSAGPPGEPARVAVVSLGTAGQDAVPSAVAALRAVDPELEVVLVGAGFEANGNAVRRIPSAATLAPILARADVCVVGGGLTKYEAAYLGRPTAVLSRTPGEAADTALFAERGLAHDLGRVGAVDSATLQARIRELGSDAALRRRLAAAARSFFPDHPARRAGEAVDRLVRGGRVR